MFIIESEKMHQGGLVEWESYYRLRHLTTHNYLALGSTITENEEVENRRLKLVSEVSKAGSFKFELIYSTLTSRNQ